MAATAAPPAKGPAKPGAAPPVKAAPRPRSFLVGTQDVIEGGDYDQTQTVDTTSHSMQSWALQATGWLKGLWFLCTGTAQNAGATVQFASNGPWSVFGNVELDDVNNEAIFGPFDGYTWMLTNKFGGYQFSEDPRAANIYRATTGAGTSAGSFTFALYIPLEIVRRDALGAAASVNNTASLTVKLTTNPIGSVYSTVPTGTTPLSMRVQGTQVYYWQPMQTDKAGRQIMDSPPAAGTTQYWTQGNLTVSAGTVNQQLNTALGYPWRNYLFVLVDSNSSRAQGESDWPDPLIQLKFEANSLYSQYQKSLWNRTMGADYGYQGSTFDQASALENGVKAVNWNKDFAFNKPGSETRKTYLVTSTGSNWIFNGSVGGSGTHTLFSLVNYIAPPRGANKGDTAALTGGQ